MQGQGQGRERERRLGDEENLQQLRRARLAWAKTIRHTDPLIPTILRSGVPFEQGQQD